jgi:hypothetical protein
MVKASRQAKRARPAPGRIKQAAFWLTLLPTGLTVVLNGLDVVERIIQLSRTIMLV